MSERLALGDLVQVFAIFNEDVMDWDECCKVGLVIGINEHESNKKQYAPKQTFVTIMIDGVVYDHEYYESELQKIQ